MNSRLGHVLLAALAWTILGCVFALPDLSSGTPWRHALLLSLTLWWSWGLLTPLILWVDRQIPVSNRHLVQRVLAHLIPSLLITCLYIYVMGALRAAFHISVWDDWPSLQFLLRALRGLFLWDWLVYWLILGSWQVWRYYEHYLADQLRLERLEKSFSEARLNALRMQLDPHFLFNALNTISSQLERDPKLARRMIEHLGDLLRLSLDSRDRQEIPLSEEMAFLEHYLAIQKIRFGDHLRIEMHIHPEVKHASVPCLFLQPLVENAIRHGISRRASGGTVLVSAQRNGNHLDIRVVDNGVGLPPDWTLQDSAGTGLSVTQQRLAGLYPGGQASLAVNRRADGGTEVVLSLPLRGTGEEGL